MSDEPFAIAPDGRHLTRSQVAVNTLLTWLTEFVPFHAALALSRQVTRWRAEGLTDEDVEARIQGVIDTATEHAAAGARIVQHAKTGGRS